MNSSVFIIAPPPPPPAGYGQDFPLPFNQDIVILLLLLINMILAYVLLLP